MKKFFRSKKFIGVTSALLATSLVLGTIAVRKSQKGIQVGIPTVNADSDLMDYDSSSQVNYSTVLGRAVDYGILTRNLEHLHHMQTTFATSVYTGGKYSCDANLSGPAAAQFIVAEMTEGSELRFSDDVYNQHMNYVVDTTYELAYNPPRIHSVKPNLIEVLPRTYEKDVLNTNLDKIIDHIQTESAALAAKPAIDVDDVLKRSATDPNQYILDLDDDSYEGATIYFDVEEGSPFLTAMGNNLEIKKRSSTIIVFNVKGSNVTLKNVNITAAGKEKQSCTTNWSSPLDEKNTFVDQEIARKLIWNMPEATEVVLDSCAGAFIVPRNDAHLEVAGTPSAGWIACAGTTTIEKCEFHFVFTDRTEEGNDVHNSYMHFATKKAFTKDFSQPNKDENVLTNVRLLKGDYSFSLTEMTDATFSQKKDDAGLNPNPAVVDNDDFGKVTFPSLTVDVTTVDPRQPLHRYFKITETQNVQRDTKITASTGEIDIDMEIRNIEGIIHYYITSYHYATAQDKANGNYYKKNDAVEMSGTEFSLGGFYNLYEVETASIEVTKRVEFENDDSTGFPTDKKYKVAIKKGAQYVQNDSSLGGAPNYFEVSADGTLRIDNLMLGEYTIVEDEGDVGDFELTTTYNSQTVTLTSNGEVGSSTITNHYKKVDHSNEATLKVKKTVEVEGETTLPKAFANKEYPFIVKATPTAGGQAMWVENTNGGLVYSPSIMYVKAGEEVEIKGLQPGYSYEVEEWGGYGPQQIFEVGGYDFKQNDSTTQVTVPELGAGDVGNAELINKYEKQVGYLRISKRFVEADINNIQQSSTDITNPETELDLSGLVFHVTGPNGFSRDITWSEFTNNEYVFTDPVPLGKYTITETGAEQTGKGKYVFVQAIVGDTTVGPGENQAHPKNVVVRNAYRNTETNPLPTGSLMIQKSVVPSTASMTSFNLLVTTVQNGQTLYCKFDGTGAFVSADVVAQGADLSAYKVAINTNGGNGNLTLTGLPIGTYTVSEVEEDAVITDQHLQVSYNNQTVTFTDNDRNKNVNINNIYSSYSIKVKKVVAGTPVYNNPIEYPFYIKCGDQFVQANGTLGSDKYFFSVTGNSEKEIVLRQGGDYEVVERFQNWEFDGTEKAYDYNINYTMTTTYSSTGVSISDSNQSDEVTITNTYKQKVEKGSLTVSKQVTGDVPATGAPSSYSFYVKCGDQYVQDDTTGALGSDPVPFTVSTSTSKEIKGLALDKTYIVEEVAVTGLPEGYTCDASFAPASVDLDTTNKDGAIEITNNYTYTAPETVDLTVKKVWDDNNNQDGIRPTELKVTLKKNGTTLKEVTLNAANNWTATESGLRKKEGGVDIVYTWVEDEASLPQGYAKTDESVSTDGLTTTFTNKHTPETTSVTVIKDWDDKGNVAGKRPDSIEMTLSNGRKVTLNAANNWTATVEGLPKYANGTLINYTWTEGSMPEGYTQKAQTKSGSTTTITNTYDLTRERITASVEKIWVDNNNNDGKRPTGLTVTLNQNGSKYQDVTLNEANGWKATVNNLPKFDNAGVEYTYTWVEPSVTDYTSSSTPAGAVMTFTNTHADELTSATVTKNWVDKDNKLGKRPSSIEMTLSNGQKVTLNASNNWTGTIGNLPKYANGTLIDYTWSEGSLPAGYTRTNTKKDDNDDTITIITNTYDMNTERIDVSVTKIWDDFNNVAGKRPSSLTVTLSNGTPVTLNEANNWSATVSDLPKYDANGDEIEYTWTEGTMPEGYTPGTSAKSDTTTTLTNTYDLTREKTTATVHKVWDDANDLEGKRLTELTVVLKQNGSDYDSVLLNDANGWTATIPNLPKFDAAGNSFVYTWSESGIPSGYQVVSAQDKTDPTLTTITNTFDFTTVTTSVSVEKIWNDNNNNDGKRPIELAVTLKQNGSNYDTVLLSEANGWKYDYNGLLKYDTSGSTPVEYVYEWTEPTVPEYTPSSSTTGGATTFTNKHTDELTQVSVKKIWDDNNNSEGKRPATLKVTLNNGTEVTLDDSNNWTATVKNLPKYNNGSEIIYTWTEENVPDYVMTGNGPDGTDPTLTVITNRYDVNAVTTTASVEKVWVDDNNQDGIRPVNLTVTLLQNGSDYQTVTLSDANNWTETVNNLPKYDLTGKPYTYSWAEPSVTGYSSVATTSGNDATFTNTHASDQISVSIQKNWEDKNNKLSTRPATLQVTLNADGVKYDDYTLDEAGNWTTSVGPLPKYNNGTEIVYTWEEDLQTAGYTMTGMAKDTTDPNKTIITNTYDMNTEKIDVSVTKVWEDFSNVAGKRPSSLTVTLSNGTDVVLNEANNWTETVSNLPKYDSNGDPINYTWTETLPSGYKEESNTTSGTVTTIVNSYDITLEKTTSTVKKVWKDNNDQDGKRPVSITVHLKQNGTSILDEVLDASNNWTATAADLQKFDSNGVAYTYTWEEDAVTDYNGTLSTLNGVTTITNTHEAEKTTLRVQKTWDHKTNPSASQPTEVTVELYANNALKATRKLNASNSWSEEVTDLPVYENGSAITYEWREVAVANYLTTYSTSGNITTIKNTYDNSTEKTEVSVTKVWDDANNQDGKRPASVTVYLKQNTVTLGDPFVLNDANNWTATKSSLPKYDGDGNLYDYTWEEAAVADYTASYSKSGTTTTITNKHNVETTKAIVTKNWDDNNNAARKRPSSIVMTLVNDTTKTVTLNDANNWTQQIDGLPMYKDGQKITYTWTEGSMPEGYQKTGESVSADGLTTTFTNTYTAPTGSLKVSKSLANADSTNKNKTFAIVITFSEAVKYSVDGGTPIATADTTYTANLADGQSVTLGNIPEGVTYSISETISRADQDAGYSNIGYTGSQSAAIVKDTTTEVIVKNSYTKPAEYGSLKVTKSLANADSTNKNKEFTIAISFSDDVCYAVDGGTPITTATRTYTAKLADGKSVTLSNIPADVTYTVSETISTDDKNAGYSFEGFTGNESAKIVKDTTAEVTVNNKYTKPTEYVSVSVKKVWDDNNNQDGLRPTSLNVTLNKNGSAHSTVTLTEAEGWEKTVTNLPKYDGTTENQYTWSEDTVPSGYTLVSTVAGTPTVITNSHTPEEITVSVVKVWADKDNAAGKRPASLKVTLNADGSKYTEVELSDANNWTASFTVPKCNNGSEINYTWAEEALPAGYTKTSSVSGNTTTLTNTYDLAREKTQATVKKVWDDNNDQAQVRPASLKFTLSNGTEVTLSDANNWTETVTDLAKFDADGKPITYTWTEDEASLPQGYAKTKEEVSADGLTTTFTNTYTAPAPVLGSLKIKKVLAADAPASASSTTYNFTVEGPNGYKVPVSIVGAGEAELNNLELGKYTITEDEKTAEIDGYELSVSNNGLTIELTDDVQKTAEITNAYAKKTEPTQTDTQPTDTQPTGTQPTGTQQTSTSDTTTTPSETNETEAPSESTTTPTPDKEIDSVTIDDTPVKPEDYKLKPNGTIEFTPETIEGLTLGVHRAVIKYTDGTTRTIEFEVITSSRGKHIVKTGDVGGTNLVPVVTLFSVAAAAIAIVIFRKRKIERCED